VMEITLNPGNRRTLSGRVAMFATLNQDKGIS
jgi:hypothetical protein